MARRANALVLTLILLSALAPAANDRVVDSATFAIYLSGKRAATEKFEIRQGASMSIVRSEFRTDDGKSQLRADMQLATNGNLVRYDVREFAPGKMMTSIEPVEMFLVQRTFTKPGQKHDERPYVMPHSTAILDDYFFSQRQVLLWRYLAQTCAGQPDCVPQKAQFGAIIPQQQSAISVNVDFAGPEKVLLPAPMKPTRAMDVGVAAKIAARLAGQSRRWGLREGIGGACSAPRDWQAETGEIRLARLVSCWLLGS